MCLLLVDSTTKIDKYMHCRNINHLNCSVLWMIALAWFIAPQSRAISRLCLVSYTGCLFASVLNINLYYFLHLKFCTVWHLIFYLRCLVYVLHPSVLLLYHLRAMFTFLHIKILKVNVHRPAIWNRICKWIVCIPWVAARISFTDQKTDLWVKFCFKIQKRV